MGLFQQPVEPEVLHSLDDHRPDIEPGPVKRIGCSVGPGCGCLGLPLALIAGLALSTVVALAWLLRIGRAVEAVSRLALGRRRGGAGRGGTGAA